MDYSATIQDADNPAGASPWGSPGPSPEHSRTGFRGGSEPPSSPYQGFGSQAPSNGLTRESDEEGFGAGEHEYRRPDTASTVSACRCPAGRGQDRDDTRRPAGR